MTDTTIADSGDQSTYVRMIREAVAVFRDERALAEAVDDLEEHGFDRREISLMASEQAVKDKLGDRYQRIEDAADDPATPRKPYVGAEDRGTGEGALIGGLGYVGAAAAGAAVVASGGAVAAAIAAVVAGGAGGGAVGGLLARWVGRRHADDVEEHLRRGGLLLWVALRDASFEAKALEILPRHTEGLVRLHDIPAVDPTAGANLHETWEVGLPVLFHAKRRNG